MAIAVPKSGQPLDVHAMRLNAAPASTNAKKDRRPRPKPVYETGWGRMYQGDSGELLREYPLTRRRGKAQLLLTSPPFPLNRKKRYGNLTGDDYLQWLTQMAPLFRQYLKQDGSIVLEIGNAWEPGKPTMSTLPIKALMAFQEAANLHLCQEFICFNPARLPSPAQWVNVERIRVKDAFTRVWWMSPVERPKAYNRNVLTSYSKSMVDLLRKGTYNSGARPSQHRIGERSFLHDNGGAIPPNVLIPNETVETITEVLPIANTRVAWISPKGPGSVSSGTARMARICPRRGSP